MKHTAVALLSLFAASQGAPVAKLANFELTDQEARQLIYRFPKAKVTVITVADHKGSEQPAPWIQRIRDRYETRIDIDGIADVSIVPKMFQGMVRDTFRKKLTYSVMLDWEGDVVKQFSYKKGVANIYLVDRDGRVVKQIVEPISERAAAELFNDIDRVMTVLPSR